MMGNKAKAEKQYKLAVEANPNYAAAYYNYGIILNEMGRFDEAEKQYKLSLEKDPNSADAH